MISREEAIDRLISMAAREDIAANLDDEVALRDIARCITAEISGLHLWEADDEEVKWLFTYPPAENDPGRGDFIKKCDELYKKYAFGPSQFENKKENDNER